MLGVMSFRRWSPAIRKLLVRFIQAHVSPSVARCLQTCEPVLPSVNNIFIFYKFERESVSRLKLVFQDMMRKDLFGVLFRKTAYLQKGPDLG